MALTVFPGVAKLLAAHSAALPQPDQLCGPFSASVALAGLMDDAVPSVTELAVASGSAVWPHDLSGARPPGVPVHRDGWDDLTTADRPENAGTNAANLAAGIEMITGHDIAVVAVAGPSAKGIRQLLASLDRSRLRFGLLANLRTGFVVDLPWDVGHFVVAWGFDEDTGDVAVADTYAELGSVGMPSGCRLVGADALADAMSVDGGRGLMLLVPDEMRDAAVELVVGLGLSTDLWST